MGYAVAGAGDVNGDGYADVIVGAHNYDSGSAGEGAAFVFHGNAEGRPVLAQQRRSSSGLQVAAWGRSNDADDFQVRMTATDPRGRGQVKLEVEACRPGLPFGNAGCSRRVSPTWSDAILGGFVFTEIIDGLATDVLYRWRARVLYAPSSVTAPGITAPPKPAHSPWRRLQAQASEADVRIGFGCGSFGALIEDVGDCGKPAFLRAT